MNLLFYIIFVPHSVNYLQYGVISLLQLSSDRYCLVSNGLDTKEHHAPSRIMPEIALQPGFLEDLTAVHKMDTGVLMNMLAVQVITRQWPRAGDRYFPG